MSAERSHLSIRGLSVKLGKFALGGIDLECGKGEYHILMGPNGCGKSSFLKCILGIHKLDGGQIFHAGEDVSKEPPETRDIGYVPQNYALFPHLNVERNLRFGIGPGSGTVREADALVDRLCGMLGIEHLRSREVHNLSGGERQKVALGRALGAGPKTVLLDEPFSAVDEGRKRGLWYELKNVIEEVGITAIHVTHNFEEAYTLGGSLSVMLDGKLVQTGQKREIFERPGDERVAEYLGYRNVFTGVARQHEGGTRVETPGFSVVVDKNIEPGHEVKLCVRQSDIKVVKKDVPLKDSLAKNVFEGTIVDIFPLTDYCLMWFKVAGSEQRYDFELRFPRHISSRLGLSVGEETRVAFWSPTIIVFD